MRIFLDRNGVRILLNRKGVRILLDGEMTNFH
jgi:hypothetical protein